MLLIDHRAAGRAQLIDLGVSRLILRRYARIAKKAAGRSQRRGMEPSSRHELPLLADESLICTISEDMRKRPVDHGSNLQEIALRGLLGAFPQGEKDRLVRRNAIRRPSPQALKARKDGSV